MIEHRKNLYEALQPVVQRAMKECIDVSFTHQLPKIVSKDEVALCFLGAAMSSYLGACEQVGKAEFFAMRNLFLRTIDGYTKSLEGLNDEPN